MRELIDRKTVLATLRKELNADDDWLMANIYEGIANTINEIPTVTRMQEESYQRLIRRVRG